MNHIYVAHIAGTLGIKDWQVENCAALFEEGCTVPFISRYRKEKTGGLDDEQVAAVRHWTNDASRKVFVCPYHVVMIDEAEEELEGYFRSEDEAVKFIRTNNSNIPGYLTTLSEINDYCMDNGLNILWHYSKTEISNICPPVTAKLIKCLIEATHIQ